MTRARVGGFVALVAGALALLAWSQAEAACEADKVSAKYPGLAGRTLKVGLDPTLPPVMYRDQSEKCVAAGKPSVEITTYPNAPATTRAIQNDRADLSMYDLVLVDEVVRQNRDTLERAFAFNTGIKIGVAVKKGNAELARAVKEALEALQANGTQRRLLQKNGIDPGLIIPVEILRQ